MAETVTMSGPLHRWTLDPSGQNYRDYTVVTIPFKEFNAAVRPEYFNGGTGKGEQRKVLEAYAKRLARELAGHAYTPTSFGVGLTKKQQEECVAYGEDGRVTITVPAGKPLRRTDGNHRSTSLLALLSKAREDGDDKLVALIEGLPVTAFVYLNGDPQEDFINLQSGKAVDANHLFTMKLRRKSLGEKVQGDMERALEVAKLLNAADASPFHSHIQLDTRGPAWLKFTSLAAKGSSDQSTSLFGLVRVCPEADAKWLAATIIHVFNTLAEGEPDLVTEGMPLAAPKEGVVGSCGLLVGVAICVAYRLSLRAKDARQMTVDDQLALLDAAKKMLGKPADDLSAAAKRRLIREFAVDYFSDLGEDDGVTFHDNLPVGLLDRIPPSAYQARPLPAAPKKKGG